ncbi:hypothetical protein H2199_005935 [Coniosporium tulheliwenetii]|uniref:Uncharacterized protein n=1 Tax=Coniosporium tulheliwenetii TaxID=3383036 RepID=A0ACC2YY83_9PEZI|nr:hypothetical protein H2199_005935 [Cladosporium sp. JES 115]
MATATPRREPHTEFRDVTAHTAKCDVCNQKNKQILKRCLTCSWGICTPCSRDRGNNLTHGAAAGASYPRPTPIPSSPTPALKAEDTETSDLTKESPKQSAQAPAATKDKGKSRATASSSKAAATQHKKKARVITDSEDEDDATETYIPRATRSGRQQSTMPPPTSLTPSLPVSSAGPATPRRTTTRRKTAQTTQKSAVKKAAEKSTQGEASSSASASQAASRHGTALPAKNRVVAIAQSLIEQQNQDEHGQERASTGISAGSSYPAPTDGLMTLGLATAHQEGYRQRQLTQGLATLRHEPRGLSPEDAPIIAEHGTVSARAGDGTNIAPEVDSSDSLFIQRNTQLAQRQPELSTNDLPQGTMRSTPERETIAQAVVGSIYTARMRLSNIEFHATMTAASEAVKRADEERYWADINPLRDLLQASSQLAAGEPSLAPSTPYSVSSSQPAYRSTSAAQREYLPRPHSRTEVPQLGLAYIPEAANRASSRAAEQSINVAPSGSFFRAVNADTRDSGFAVPMIPPTVRQQDLHQRPAQTVAGPSIQRSSSRRSHEDPQKTTSGYDQEPRQAKRSRSTNDQDDNSKPKRHKRESSRDDLTPTHRSLSPSDESDLSSVGTETLDTPSCA